tara:strand:- start:9605 stop:10168 length:564 start_codon:yes stop_codon:yes gene_type:complete
VVVIALFSPVEERASRFFAEIDVQALVDTPGARASEAKLNETDQIVELESTIEEAVDVVGSSKLASAKELPGYPGQLMNRTRLRAQPLEGPAKEESSASEAPDELLVSDQSKTSSIGMRTAVADAQAYSGRIFQPKAPEADFESVVVEKIDKLDPVKPEIPKIEPNHLAKPASGQRKIHQIRPISSL